MNVVIISAQKLGGFYAFSAEEDKKEITHGDDAGTLRARRCRN
jgi:hypothetical protein